MAYCTLQDLQDRFGEDEIKKLADRDADGQPDSVVVDTAITDADAKIDSYISERYNLPFSAIPALVKSLSCDITRYHLFDNKPSDIVAKRYKEAINFLESVQEGKTSLGVEPASSQSAPAFTQPTTEFDDAKLSGY